MIYEMVVITYLMYSLILFVVNPTKIMMTYFPKLQKIKKVEDDEAIGMLIMGILFILFALANTVLTVLILLWVSTRVVYAKYYVAILLTYLVIAFLIGTIKKKKKVYKQTIYSRGLSALFVIADAVFIIWSLIL